MKKKSAYKKHLPTMRFLFYTLFAITILWFFQSDFFVARIVLPLTANYYGCTLTVSRAGYNFLTNNILFADELVLTGDNGNELTVKRAEIRLSFFRLLRGCLHIKDATLRDINVKIITFPEGGDNETSFDPDRFHIGAVHMSKITITHGSRELYIQQLQSSGTFENVQNTLYGNGTFSNGKHCRLPINFSLQWNRKYHQWLNEFTGDLEILPGTGVIFNRNLADLHFRILFSGNTDSKNKIHWRTTLECEGLGPAKDVLSRTYGTYDPVTGKGAFRGEMKGHFSEAELRKGLGIFAGSKEVPVPENLTLQQFTGKFNFDRNTFFWNCDLTASIDRLWFEGKEYLPSTKLNFSNTGSFAFREAKIHMAKLKMEFLTDQSSFTVKNQGAFLFFFDQNGWHVDANNSKLVTDIHNIPAALVDVWIPVKFTAGVINGQYSLTADSQLQRLKGMLSLSGQDLAVSMTNEPFVAPFDFVIKMDLESRGLDRIRSLSVKHCTVNMKDKKKRKLLQADLSGTWYFKKHLLDLNGDMKIFSYAATEVVYDPFVKKFHDYLAKHNYKDIVNRSKIRIRMNLAPEVQNEQLAFQFDTIFNSFIFLGKQYKNNPLNLSIHGKSSFLKDTVTVQFPHVRLYSKDLVDISADGQCSFPDCMAKIQVKLNRFTPEFWNRLAKITEWELDHMKYKSLTGYLNFTLSGEAETIRFHKGALNAIPVEGASMSMVLDRELFTTWKDLPKIEIPMTFTMKNLPMNWWNCLLPHGTSFRFLSGIANAKAEVTAKNCGENVYFRIDSMVKDASFGASGTIWEAGDCKINGNFLFPDYCRDIEFHALKLTGYHDKKEYVSFLTDGFAGMESDRETALRFTIQKSTPRFLQLLSSSFPETKQFDITGRFTYDADASYDKNRFTWDLAFRKLQFRKAETYPDLVPLNGSLKMEMLALPDTITFQNIALFMKDQKNTPYFDLFGYSVPEQNGAIPGISYEFKSNALDLKYLFRLLSEQTDTPPTTDTAVIIPPEEQNKANTAMLHAFIRRMKNKRFGFDLKNMRFTDHLNMTLRGSAGFTENGIKTNTVRWDINPKGETELYANISIPDDGIAVYDGKITLRNVSLVPFFDAYAEYNGKKAESLNSFRGEICDADLRFSGKGLSRNALQENMHLDLLAKFKDLSIPHGAKDVSVLLSILLFPLEQIPALINKIKFDTLKIVLQNIMGEHINMVTGKQNLEFKEGEVRITGNKDHFLINKMLFQGPTLRFYVINGHVQPFRNKLYLDTQIRVGTMRYPLVFDCPLDNPDYNLNLTLQRWIVPMQLLQDNKK
ncbi:MAG: hypothetical protein IKB16_06255 [Lentisphaeria bacterium]|nr:hypothetical protein [Lentisphaeria bacterium]